MGAGKAGDEAQAQRHVLTQQILGTGSSISPFILPLPPQPYFHLPDGASWMAGRKKDFCGSGRETAGLVFSPGPLSAGGVALCLPGIFPS